MRSRALLAAGVLAFAALTMGLWAVHRVFADTRADAHAAVAAREAALAEIAARTLQMQVALRLRVAQIRAEAALEEPLDAPTGLALLRDGALAYPRVPARPAYTPSAADLARALVTDAPRPSDDPDAPWAHLAATVRDALTAPDGAALTDAVRRHLAARALHVLAPERELTATLVLLEHLARRPDLDRRLARALVRDGLEDDHGARVASLQQALLAQRARLSAEDFDFLAARVHAISRALDLPADDFVAAAGPLDVPPPIDRPASPTLDAAGWLVGPVDADLVAVRATAADLAAQVTDELVERGVLGPDDLVLVPDDVGPLSSSPLTVSSPSFAAARAAADARYRLSLAFLAAFAALALAAAAAVAWAVRRHQRALTVRADLLAAAAHELRTPLASIRALAETLTLRPSAAPDYPARILREADALIATTENVLAHGRLDAARLTPTRAPLRLGPLLEDVADEVAAHAAAALTVTHYGLDGLTAHADRPLVRLVLRNLLANAAAHAGRDAVHVQVTGARAPGRVLLTVRDDGHGVPDDARAHLFTPFTRGAAPSRGAGVGLALSRKIARAHGGDLALTATGPHGSTFTLTLPALPAPPP